jgi:competence protein CoiA
MMERNTRHSDAYQSRCFGLVPGIAFAENFKTRVGAEFSVKDDGPFFCPECLSEAIVRKCSDKDDHFAHKARMSPTAKKGDTKFHHMVRDEIFEVLKKHFPEGGWSTEKQMRKNTPDENIFIPDISGYFGERGKTVPAVAIEVQCSSYTPAYIRKKTIAYEKKNVNVLWIVPLKKDLGGDEFRPRRYELFLHSMYFGYVFYYTPGDNGILTPIHYGPSFRFIDFKTFHDTNAEEITTGGYYLKYKTLKKPISSNKVAIYDLIPKSSVGWVNPNNKKLSIPTRQVLALDKKRWWSKDENKQWLKDNDAFQYFKTYNEDYNPDDEADLIPDDLD